MKEKKPFVANRNHFYIFIGIFLCLFTIILCLNDQYAGRILSTPFTYVFGAFSYLIYLAINLLGLRFIFVKKLIKIKVNVYILASILVIVAGSIFFTHFASLNSLSNQYSLHHYTGPSGIRR